MKIVNLQLNKKGKFNQVFIIKDMDKIFVKFLY